MRSAVRIVGFLCICAVLAVVVQAQSGTGILRGQVSDPSGAVVTQATVTATSPTGQNISVQTNSKGAYEIRGLAPGKYNLRVTAKGFAPYDLADVNVVTGDAPPLEIGLQVAVEEQKVTVEGEATSVSTDADSNASAVVIKGKDLDALSDDPDELQSDLEALAGPSAGPNGGQIYIDGFSNGTLPPKSSIREIRVNQNPFSAQYDRLGFGRVEVFTKPGTDQYHGQFQTNVSHSVFNARNPFLRSDVAVPDYHSAMYNGNFGGPISKRASFFFNFHRRDLSEISITSGAWIPCEGFDLGHPCSTFAPPSTAYSNTFPNPNVHSEFSPRIDYQVSKNNTLTGRYELEKSTAHNLGLGQFSLPSQLNVDSRGTEHNFQVSDTQIISSTMINETRFQFVRETNEQLDRSLSAQGQPAIVVMDAFTAGGNRGNSKDSQNHYEFQNYTSKVHGTHFIRFGGRVRVNSEDALSQPNPYGTFSYGSATAYYLVNYFAGGNNLTTVRNNCLDYLGSPGTHQAFLTGWSSLANVPSTPSDCGINQYSGTVGVANASVSQTDAGLYAEDDWRVRRNVTLSYGLRFETQNNIDNRVNFAPRLGIAWGLGKGNSPKTVLRAGFGMFYDRFGQGNVLRVIRTTETQQFDYVVDPTNIATLDAATLTPTASTDSTRTVYGINHQLQVPYTMQVAATLERQLTKGSKLTVSYIGSRGLHQIALECTLAIDANTPCANDTAANLKTFRYDSTGTFKQNQLMVNSQITANKYVSLMAWYVLGYANSNTSGGLPLVPFDLASDWGRSSFDVRHRGMIMGTVNLPYGLRLNPMIMASSGRPYNIYMPQDLNNDNSFSNDRPWFSNACSGIPVGSSQSNIYNTVLGCFSTTPNGLGRVPANYATGPGSFMMNLRVSKTFGLGKKLERGAQGGPQAGAGGGGGRGGGPMGPGGPSGRDMGRMMGMGASSGQRYSLTFSAGARNLFNNVNAQTPSGNLSSERTFGVPTALAGMGPFSASANRRIDLSVAFNF